MRTSLLVALSLVAGFALAEVTRTPPVARIWHGRVARDKGDEYQRYLYEAGIRKIRGVPGNLGAKMLRRDGVKESEFIVISTWPSRGAIEKFAGKEIEKVHSLPKDPEYLIEVEPTVRHFDVVVDEGAP